MLELRPDRIALYGYAHVTWRKKVQKSLERHVLPSPEERIALFLKGINALTDAGYRYIGMDHFALPDDELSRALDAGTINRNFMGYSTHRGAAVLGIGVSSVSTLPNILVQNSSVLETYQERVHQLGLAVERGVYRSTEDLLRAELIEGILCGGYIDINEFGRRWNIDLYDELADAFAALCELENDGLVEISQNSIAVTETGRLFQRTIASSFDAYLLAHLKGGNRVFSQSV